MADSAAALERKRARRRERYRSDPAYRAKINARRAAWSKKYPEKRREQDRRWRENRPQQCKAKRARHKHRRRGAVGSYTFDDVQRIFSAQKGRCAYYRSCRTKLGDDYHVDHIVPIAGGGTNSADNIQLTCPACNWSKNDRHPVDFAQSLGLLI